MLVKADTCPNHGKRVLLLLDEMHIREDIVFNRHSGAMIGFANSGKIYILHFGRKICSEEKPTGPQQVMTMFVFMVLRLFNNLYVVHL